MRLALEKAHEAALLDEVPVGAVVTRGQQIIASSGNMMRSGFDPTAHAEIQAIRAAAETLQSPRLDGCDLWVTLEPCPMCAAAISLARIDRLYFGAPDPKGGGVLSGPQIYSHATCHHAPEVYPGIGEAESARLLKQFFSERRGR
jgi:tRNA(adenine34) deaminase